MNGNGSEELHIGNVTLSLDEAKETLSAIRGGKIDAVVVEGAGGDEIFTFRDPSHPFRLLVEAMNEGAVLATRSGVICYENPCFGAMAAMDGGSLVGKALADLVAPEDRPKLAAVLARAQTGSVRGNVKLIGSGPRPVPVLLSVSPAKLVDVDVFSIVVTDLSEQSRQEELYRTARKEIEARDRLFSVAAHELRNPLALLELKAELLARLLGRWRDDGSGREVGKASDMLVKIRAQTRRVAELVSKLLDVGSIGAGRLQLTREPVDLADLVRGVVERASEPVEQSRSPVTLDLESVRGRWDRVRVEQVIENLFSNALKYGLGGPVRIRVCTRDDDARLVVEDQGRGIPEEARERIFQPYERLVDAASVQGLGVGLFITAEIVKAHGGSIRVEGRRRGGSRFVVDLPRVDPALH